MTKRQLAPVARLAKLAVRLNKMLDEGETRQDRTLALISVMIEVWGIGWDACNAERRQVIAELTATT